MHIDVYIVSRFSNIALHNINGLTYFKNNYCKYFRQSCDIYIRQISKRNNFVGKWRFLPYRSTEFYRCKILPDIYSDEVSERWSNALGVLNDKK